MTQRTFLDYDGLQRFLNNLKTIIPTKTSDITNDSGFLTQHNPVDSSLSTTSENAVQNKVVKNALDGKSDTGHTHTASEVSGLSTVATSGSYNDLSNTPTIPTVNDATLTIQKNGTTVKTFTANASSNVTANITVPTAVSELTNDSGYLTSASNLDSSKLTGTIDIARLPKGALERLVTVANQTARFALTASDVQLGDTVKQLDTGVMYIVVDESKLSSADGYTEYTAGSATSVPWSGVTGKPSSFTPSSHTHGNVTNDGKLPTASRALISDSSKNITVSSVSDTELGYLSGVTSSVQTQLNGKSASNHVHGSITNDGKLGTASRALVTDSSKKIAVSTVTATELGYVSGVTSAIQTQLNGKSASNHVHGNITNDGKVGTTANLPLITGTGGVVQAGSFGTSANTFCEGNDSRLSDARTPVAHTHVTSEVTDLLNGNHTWTGDNTFSKAVGFTKVNATTLYAQNSRVELGDSGLSGDSYNQIAFWDKNGDNLSYLRQTYTTDGINAFNFFVRNKFLNGVPNTAGTVDYAYFGLRLNADKSKEGILKASFRPYDSNAYDLGSSTYQWNNLYAKNYFYNGVAWGLDKANVWSAWQTQEHTTEPLIRLRRSNLQIGDPIPASQQIIGTIPFADKNNLNLGLIACRDNTNGDTYLTLIARQRYDSNGRANNGTQYESRIDLGIDSSHNLYLRPNSNGQINLGTSTNKWKSVWFNNLQDIATDTVEWHNSHYRGINLISDGHFANMAALLTAIRAQDWSDIYIGDYVELTFTYEGASRTVKFYVGEIDKFYNVGNNALETHHLVMITGNLGISQVMNDTNTTAGGYVGSKAHTTTLPALYAILNPLFNNAILTHRNWLSNSVVTTQSVNVTLKDSNNVETPYTITDFPLYSSGDPDTPGCVTLGDWYDCNLVLMSEVEMFGSNRFASSGIDDVMCPEGQIAAFKYNRNLQTFNRTISTWLRNVSSTSKFCYCHNHGRSYRGPANSTYVLLRPRFLIG